jgi:cell wall-associated NlpC family hydrolase
MTSDQINRYIGQKFTEEHNCYYWYREILKDIYGIQMPPLAGNHTVFSAARLIRDLPELFGGRKTDKPQPGDCVFLTLGHRPHHIGIYVIVDGKPKVLHAVEGSGIVLSDMSSLRINGWRISEYWTLRED